MAQIDPQEWDDAINHFITLSSATLRRNRELEARLTRAEYEISQWQQRSAVLEATQKDQPPLILCVLDGTGDTFSPSLVSQGIQGGRQMGQQLARSVVDYLAQEKVQFLGRPSFWVTIYLNKSGMSDTLVRQGACTADQFEQFCVGFSQSSSRFLVVDTGPDEDSATEKVKEYLDTYIRFPQTLRIFFGVSHAHRYLSLLTLLDKERHLDKLVLVQSLHSSVAELAVLRLPTVMLDGVFADDTSPPTPVSMPSPTGPLSINTSGVISNGGLLSPQSPMTLRLPGGLRPIDPTRPLHRQSPPPCNEYYLMTCTKGSECKYCHDYLLTPDELNSLACNARKAPCNFLKKGLQCENGSSCCWGHECPNGRQCFHFSKGKCWFKSDGMHNQDVPSVSAG